MSSENAGNFTQIPILDYSLLSSDRPLFISQLRHALINVGFLYLDNSPVDPKLMQAIIDYCPKLFDIPQEAKDAMRMINSPHFFGYSKLGAELTKGAVDQREQFDFGTRHECMWKPGDPEYLKLWGNAQVCFTS